MRTYQIRRIPRMQGESCQFGRYQYAMMLQRKDLNWRVVRTSDTLQPLMTIGHKLRAMGHEVYSPGGYGLV